MVQVAPLSRIVRRMVQVTPLSRILRRMVQLTPFSWSQWQMVQFRPLDADASNGWCNLWFHLTTATARTPIQSGAYARE